MPKFLVPFRAWLACLALLVICGCEAYDLGDESAPAIAVDAANPTWDNGVQQILERRCDSCHAKGERPFAPANVAPYKWGLSEGEDAFKTRYATASLASVLDAGDPMPPNYADPLSDDERAALVKYIGIVKAGQDLYASCERRTTALTFVGDIKTITDANCANCHPGVPPGGHPSSLLTAAEFKTNRLAAFEYLTGKRDQPMPPGNAGFATSANGKKLVEWLCGSAELN